MSRTSRVAVVSALAAGTFVYTISDSHMRGDELIININFWSLVALPIIIGVGLVWIRRARD